MAAISQAGAARASTFSPVGFVTRRPLAAYFALAYAGAWLAVLPLLLSRTGLGLLPVTLPVLPFIVLGALAGPALAAFLVTAATAGRAGVRDLLRRCGRWRVGAGWYLLIVVGPVLVLTLAASPFFGAGALRALARQWPLLFSLYLPAIAVGALTGPIFEEPGWRGFALPRLQARLGPLRASLLLGLLWGLWHLPGFAGGWLAPFSPLSLAGLLLGAMGFSVVATWVYNRTRGSVLLAGILLHAASNAATSLGGQLLPPEMPAWVHALVYASGIGAIAYGACAVLLALWTRGRLGYRAGGEAGAVSAAPGAAERALA
ncbi:MAG TPA: CPBP family intramembrane glutamic endopeptidase [Vicinamibacteria bacterium]